MTPPRGDLVDLVIDHLHDIGEGRCRITEEDLAAEPDHAVAQILAGLLMLHEDLQYRAAVKEQAEAAIREQEARQRRILESAPIVILEIDFDPMLDEARRLVDAEREGLRDHLRDHPALAARLCPLLRAQVWNPALLRLFAAGSLDELQRRAAEVFLDETIDRMAELVAALLDGAARFEAECSARDLEGRTIQFLLSLSVPGDPPDPRRTIVTLTDVTAQREMERELARSTERLRRAQKMEAIGTLAGGVAHDFNNLLTVIESYATFVHEGLEAGDALREDVAEILGAADRASRLTRQLLAMSRRQVVDPQVLSVNDQMVDLHRMIRRLLGEGIELQLILDPQDRRVLIDPGALEQVLVNLAVNARDAMPAGGILTMTTDLATCDGEQLDTNGEPIPPGQYVRISVTDTGTGIDEPLLPRVFEPFFTTKQPGSGTGLGLSTCYGIVSQAGGHMRLLSAPGRGTSIEVYLPLADDEDSESEQTRSFLDLRGTESVLVVEDEERVRKPMVRMLQRKGFRVHEAADGEQALRLLERESGPIDVLLTDVVMPRMSGPELADRAVDLHPELQVLFVSGYPDEVLQRQGRTIAEQCLLRKPFGMQQLVRFVRAALDRMPEP